MSFRRASPAEFCLAAHKSDPMPPPPVPLDAIAAELDKLRTEAGDIQKAIADIPDFSKFKDKVQVLVTPEGLRIDLVEDSEGLFFDIGKATVKPETIKLLKMIATHLARLPNGVVVEGYTDARPYASSGYSNWNLSADRANSARTVLEGRRAQGPSDPRSARLRGQETQSARETPRLFQQAGQHSGDALGVESGGFEA